MAAWLRIPASYQPAGLCATHLSLSLGGKPGLMVLANLLLLYATLLVLGLQYVLYDPPTSSQIDKIFGKFILAVIETMLAMFLTGQDINSCFLLMFTLFLVGKWWALFGEVRTQRQEEYPLLVSNLLYIRFWMASLLSIAFDTCMVTYTAQATLHPTLQQAMTALFLFEFTIMAISSLSTAARLMLCTIATVKIRRYNQLSQRQRRLGITTSTRVRSATAARGSSCDQNEIRIDLPVRTGDYAIEGTTQFWRKCKRWRTYLELATDLMKILIYVSYFTIYQTSYGIPIQFVRESFLILQARIAAIRDLIRLKSTMRHYMTDPTNDQIGDQETCIICYEKIERHHQTTRSTGFTSRWRVGMRINTDAMSEDRPKRLRCGHILHFACLTSWMERQSTCPVCRRPVQMD